MSVSTLQRGELGEDVQQAIRKAFGASSAGAKTTEDANPSFQTVEIAGIKYAISIFPTTTTVQQAGHRLRCMEVAAALGIAPQTRYADAAKGIVITDFVKALPISDRRSWGRRYIYAIADAVAILHSCQSFPAGPQPWLSLPTLFDNLWNVASEIPCFLSEARSISEVLLRDFVSDSRCACHNDLNPTNILFDGEKVWLVDWEMASQSDPMFDLATLLTFTVKAEDSGEFLHRYRKSWPIEVELSRLSQMRQVSLYFSGVSLLIEALAERPQLTSTWPARPLPLQVVFAEIGSRRMQIEQPEARFQLGCSLIEDARSVGLSVDQARV